MGGDTFASGRGSVGGPNSDEGTESLVLYVYYNPFTVNIPILYKPVFTGGGYVGGYENAGKQGRGGSRGGGGGGRFGGNAGRGGYRQY